MIEFNVNNGVRVRLTEEGRAICREYIATFDRELPFAAGSMSMPEEDADGWSRWQLWELMNRFGAKCFNGCRVPFEVTIRIEVEP